MADEKEYTTAEEAEKAKKAENAKAAAAAATAEPQAPDPGQEDADAIKEQAFGGETREAKAQPAKSSYKTR